MDRRQQIIEWSKQGAFNGDDNLPLLWFHGTDVHDPFNIFAECGETSIGFHFGDVSAANYRINDIYRMGPPEENEGLIIPVMCRAESPLRLPDLYTWGFREIIGSMLDLGIISETDADFIEETSSDETLFAAIEMAGYDCIVYSNVCENKADPKDSLIVWRAELLKSPFASSFDRADPRLLPQNETSERDYEMWRRLARTIESEKAELDCARENVVSFA